MNKIISILVMLVFVLMISSCAEKEKVDTSKAPQKVRDAVQKTFQKSKQLTDIQLIAGADGVLDSREIMQIGSEFRELTIINIGNKKDFANDKYFNALKKEMKKEFDQLADTVVFLRNCKGYDELGLAIQKIAIEFKDDVK